MDPPFPAPSSLPEGLQLWSLLVVVLLVGCSSGGSKSAGAGEIEASTVFLTTVAADSVESGDIDAIAAVMDYRTAASDAESLAALDAEQRATVAAGLRSAEFVEQRGGSYVYTVELADRDGARQSLEVFVAEVEGEPRLRLLE